MQLSYDVPCRLARFMFCVLMVLAWSGAPRLSRGQVGAPAASRPAGGMSPVEELDRGLQALDDADKAMGGEEFDVDAVVGNVGKDPAKLFEWVRDRTTWAPYHGTLRGPVGVLMDRMGDSLDR